MKDISHLYEVDYLANPKKFEELGVKARTREELENEGLIYIENSGGERFVINKKDIKPLIRSPKELNSYLIKKASYLVFNPSKTSKPGKHSLKYIKWGEKHEVVIKRGRDKDKRIIGYNNLSSTKAHKPNWYNVSDLKPAHIISYKFIKERHFTPYSNIPILADHTCDMVYSKRISDKLLWIYINSTILYLIKELYGMRMGGGGAPLQILTGIYKNLPCFDLNNLKETEDKIELLNRNVLPFKEELKNENRRKLDIYILEAMGFKEPEKLIEKLYESYVEVVNDRIVKGKSSKKNK